MNRLEDWVRRAADARPEGSAIVFGSECVSYGALDAASSQLARALAAAGVGPGDRVALLVPKSPLAITAMLGVLKAGATYAPMDLKNPVARIAQMLQALRPRAVLATRAAADLLTGLEREGGLADVRLGWLEADARDAPSAVAFTRTDLAAYPARAPAVATATDDLAHILFTSGSTGVPKGVMITHANVRNFVEWAVPHFGIGPADRVSGHSPLHFDLSTFDVYGAFAAGATLYPVPPELNLLPHKVADLIRTAALTQWFSVPSILLHMAKCDAVAQDDFPTLRRLLWCGEAFPTAALIHWMRRLPHVAFTNLYGPTETTIASSYYHVTTCPANPQQPVPIGRPCDGEALLVLDDRLDPVRDGSTGDLYIAGPGLSPGYWGDPDKTRAAFVPDPREPGARLYRTGDLARVDGQGDVVLVGRRDSQVKSRGYRIELGEIEAALHALEVLRECAVVPLATDGFEGTVLACAYVPQPGTEVTPATLRQSLGKRLPPYMLPTRWQRFDHLPLNANGKVDRRALQTRFAPPA
ncbi:MAG TPA: amino acid adenylation domain-containing protein [Gemmatimonadales bacterium]|nr:amino acid adenylation domain-containing protein [Gemmatimonadales bacterium]